MSLTWYVLQSFAAFVIMTTVMVCLLIAALLFLVWLLFAFAPDEDDA